jgi:heme/copper-type cytochrome/quinol oxidase subunit 1
MRVKITQDMLVKDVNIKYPICREVFKKYGIGGCGGEYGPPEPIDFFAKAHNVNLGDLIRDLEKAAEESNVTSSQPIDLKQETEEELDEKRLNKLYKLFIKAALVFTLTGGTLFGVIALTWIAVTGSYKAPFYALTQAHGHMQTFGWVILFIMGVGYYVIPKFKMSRLRHTSLAYLSFVLMVSGIIIRGVFQPLVSNNIFGYLVALSGHIELIATLIFTYLIFQTIKTSKEKNEFFDKYIMASVIYFIGLIIFNFILTLNLFKSNTNIVIEPYNSMFLFITFLGFITMMILGVSARILPHFMGLAEPNSKLLNISFYLFNLGIILNVFNSYFGETFYYNRLNFISYLLIFHGMMFFIMGIKLFSKPIVKLHITGVDNSYMWFIKLSYAWFAVAISMIFFGSLYQYKTGQLLPHFYIGAYRHAITVGFITTIIMGVAYRILPIFNGTNLYSNKIMKISFWLIFFGNIARVGFQLGTGHFGDIAFRLMGISGYLELAALSLFSYNIVKTLNYVEPIKNK